MNINIKTELELSEEFLSDVMVTAFDDPHGGCWFWARPAQYRAERSAWTIENNLWKQVDIIDVDEDEKFVVTQAVLAKGIERIIGDDFVIQNLETEVIRPMTEEEKKWGGIGPVTRAALLQAALERDAGEIDSNDASNIVQVGLFGHVVYG